MSVPFYPDFIPLNIDLKDELHPRLSLTHDGVSEFTFCGLYLFRDRYKYRISRIPADTGGFIITGEQPCGAASSGAASSGAASSGAASSGAASSGAASSGAVNSERFFMTPCEAPDPETLDSLFKNHGYWKNISESVLEPVREKPETRGIVFTEDRDNFDYLYYREDLAQLAGKKFHKKKNHVNSFINNYPNHELKPLNAQTIPDAAEVLEKWRQNTVLRDDGDYKAAKEALDLFDSLPLRGTVFYVDGKPAGYCMGESIARGRMFAVHFEKAIDEYKGIYQFINKTFAASLPRFFTLINREQDLGDEGLRQAKMTYRPCGFVKKWTTNKAPEGCR